MDNANYYENYDWDKADLSSKTKNKIKLIFEKIPVEVDNILDIGCGDGTISVALSKKYDVTAVDRSPKALEKLNIPTILASAESIPVDTASYDMVFSSEMLEHLPDDIFYSSIEEMKRISKKYIFLTFPNNENTKKGIIKCPECNYAFNKIYHLRTLNLEKTKEWFPEYDIIDSFLTGSNVRGYNSALLNIKHKYSPADSWIPPRWTKNSGRKSTCPNCNTNFEIPYKFSIISTLCDLSNIVFSPKRPYQIGILLKKNEKDSSQ